MATFASKIVANTENDAEGRARYRFFMLSQWLQEALEAARISQSQLSRELTSKLGRSIDRAAVNKMVAGTRAIAGDELLEIERLTGFEAPQTIEVPLVGKVGAGQAVMPLDAGYPDETVPAPAQVRPDTVAVIVDGDSMYPAYDDGEILYYRQKLPPDALVNEKCIIALADGRMFVKVLRKGSTDQTWTLQSFNSMYGDIKDVVVEWVAPIEWTRRRNSRM